MSFPSTSSCTAGAGAGRSRAARCTAGAALLAASLMLPLHAAPPAPALAYASEEVPFITTPDHVTVAMLELAGVGPRDHLIDLGSGDGRIVITAARRYGARGLGVEIVPELVARSREHAQRAGVAERTEFRTEDLYATDLSKASVVTMYLLPEVNLLLRPRLLALAAGTRIVSHDWDLGDWAPDRSLTLAVPEKTIGREKLSRLHLWTVPARVDGLWCGAGGLALRLAQRYQNASATLDDGRLQRSYGVRIDGPQLQLRGAAGAQWAATVEGSELRVTAATAETALRAGQALQRAAGSACP